MKSSLAVKALTGSCMLGYVQSLNVMQLLDNVIIPQDEYLDLQSNNSADLLSSDKTALQQSFTVNLTNNFQNQAFDVFIFAEVNGEVTPDFSCYENAVRNKDWSSECQLSDTTEVYLNRDSFATELVGLDEINTQQKHVVIDNTKFPLNSGTYAGAPITTMVQTQTQFSMTYDIKSMTIYCGLLCLVLLFITLGVCYLYCKLRRDIKFKQSKLEIERLANKIQ